MTNVKKRDARERLYKKRVLPQIDTPSPWRHLLISTNYVYVLFGRLLWNLPRPTASGTIYEF